jgi:hypothetical protein
MKKMILAHRTSLPSAKILRDSFVKLGYPKVLVTRNPDKNILFSYGDSSHYGTYLVNPPDFISFMANKKLFSGHCSNVGIPAPVFTKLIKLLPESFPVLVRSTLTGSGSKGIYPVTSLKELQDMDINWWWTPYYQLTREYRVHVVGGKIIKCFCKNFDGEIDSTGIIIRNNDNSHFSLVDIENPDKYQKLRAIVYRLLESLKGKFGVGVENLFFALDLGFGKNEREYILIEGNSAPGLNESTAIKYAEILGPLLFKK